MNSGQGISKHHLHFGIDAHSLVVHVKDQIVSGAEAEGWIDKNLPRHRRSRTIRGNPHL